MTSIDVSLRGRVAHATRAFTIELYDGRDLAAAGWPSITANPELHMHPYQSRDFLDVWMATIGAASGVQSCLVVVKDRDGRPLLYLPFAIEKKYNVRLLRFMDQGVADFNAPILAANCNLSRAEFAAIWTEILRRLPNVDAIDLQKISGHVCGANNPLTYLQCRSFESSGHAICLSEPRQAHYSKPSISRMRAKLRRLRKKLDEKGPVEFRTNGSAPAEAVDRLFELKCQQYLRTMGYDFFAMPGVADFYRQMAEPSRIGRISHLSALTCGSAIVSVHLGFVGRGRFHWVLPVFDIQYRQFAVGHMLLHHLIDHCFDEGYKTFDLGEGDYSYKAAWATHRLALWSFERAMTPSGLLYLQLRRARRLVGRPSLHDWYAKGRSRIAGALGIASIAEALSTEREGIGRAAL